MASSALQDNSVVFPKTKSFSKKIDRCSPSDNSIKMILSYSKALNCAKTSIGDVMIINN